MTSKELKKLSRAELLRLLLLQTRETENALLALEEARRQIEERNLRLEKTGSLAEAVLEINGVAVAVQAAADQYLENIAAMEQECRSRCEELLHAARSEAAQLLDRAHAEAEAILNKAREAAPVRQSDSEFMAEIHHLLGE